MPLAWGLSFFYLSNNSQYILLIVALIDHSETRKWAFIRNELFASGSALFTKPVLVYEYIPVDPPRLSLLCAAASSPAAQTSMLACARRASACAKRPNQSAHAHWPCTISYMCSCTVCAFRSYRTNFFQLITRQSETENSLNGKTY